MSEASQSLTHSRWHGTYHVVFVPKRRRKALFGHMRKALGPILHALARQKECRSIAGPLLPDHVRLCLERPPKDAVAAVIGSRTGKRAMAIARPFAGRERHCAGEHVWARGDAVSTGGFEKD